MAGFSAHQSGATSGLPEGRGNNAEYPSQKTQVERAENILSKLGLSMSEAVSLFLAQVLWDGLPFGVALPDPDDREDMAPIEGQLSLDNEPEIPWDEDVSAEV